MATKQSAVKSIVLALVDQEQAKRDHDRLFSSLSKRAIKLLGVGDHTFLLPDGRVARVTVLEHDAEYVEVDAVKPVSL